MPVSNPIGLPVTVVAPGQPFLSNAIPLTQPLCKLSVDGAQWTADVRMRAHLLVAEDGLTFREMASMGGVPADLFNGTCTIGVDFGTSNPLRAVKCAAEVTQGSIQLVASFIPATPDIVVNPNV